MAVPHPIEDSRVHDLLRSIYGDAVDDGTIASFDELVARHSSHQASPRVTERPHAWLIAYPDHIRGSDTPLAELRRFADRRLPDAVEAIHVLPCFPSSSDEGFSVMDYTAIDPAFGTWTDIEAIAARRHLMLDAVINHASARGTWFEEFLADVPDREGFFRTESPDRDTSQVVRARQHPLLTRFESASGPRWVWTTFSADQVDLDYRNPRVTLAIADVLLTYAAHGATAIRLDAIGFLWKDPASPSIHLRETHLIIRLFRAILDCTYPSVRLISETNVPHAENITYLGTDGEREADLVYQFPLPPLVLNAYATGDAGSLTAWLSDIDDIPAHTAYFNFLASHDGVGLRPLEGLVSRQEVDELVAATLAHGGMVNYRSGPDGTLLPYELNGTWLDLIRFNESEDDALAKHISSHGLMFALRGEPAIYLQALLAESNATDLAEATGMARSLNRRRFEASELDARLEDATSRSARSIEALGAMLTWTRDAGVFGATHGQRILDLDRRIVGIERLGPDGQSAVVYANVSGDTIEIETGEPTSWHGQRATIDDGRLSLGPWGIAFLAFASGHAVPTR